MPGRPALVDSRMMPALTEPGFPDVAEIQAATEAQSASGAVTASAWAAVAGLEDVPAHVAPATSKEARATDRTVTTSTHTIALQGDRAVTTKHRALVAGRTYNIIGVRWDSARAVTYLDTEVVE